ncbi:MAG: hypothetical protein K8H84_07880 [Sulfuricella denitrificans]|nr:hypothetical protein [Sulfuricella denitrificans]
MGKRNFGTMPCSECGKEVVVKENENETLSYSCAWCDDSNYAKKGTGKHSGWKSRIKPLESAPTPPAPPATKPKTQKTESGLIL